MTQLRLHGWKAIGNFLGRDRTTAIRWAKDRGLPVHCVPGGRTGTVYALATELDEWLAKGTNATHLRSDVRKPRNLGIGRLRSISFYNFIAALGAVVAFITWRAAPSDNELVGIAVIDSPSDDVATRRFTRSLSADLARFANASTDMAVYDHVDAIQGHVQYGVQVTVEGTSNLMVARVWLTSQADGSIIWSRTIDQAGVAQTLFRERVAANVVGLLRCGFGMPGNEIHKLQMRDLTLLFSICQANLDHDFELAAARAQKMVLIRPDLAISWASLAISQAAGAVSYDDKLLIKARANAKGAVAANPHSLATQLAILAVNEGTNATTLLRIKRALRSYPNEPKLLQRLSINLFNAGYVSDSVAPSLLAVRSDPTSIFARDIAVRRLAAAGRTAEASQLQLANKKLWPDHPMITAQTPIIVRKSRSGSYTQSPFESSRSYGRQPKAENHTGIEFGSLNTHDLDRYAIGHPEDAYMIARRYESLGYRRSALLWLARAPTGAAASNQWSMLFWPDSAGLRTEPAFFDKMARNGLLEIWRVQNKWPDFCAAPDLKYDCSEESRKHKWQGAARSPT